MPWAAGDPHHGVPGHASSRTARKTRLALADGRAGANLLREEAVVESRVVRIHRWDGLALLSVGAAVAASAVLFTRLPEQLPMHFDLHGSPDRWMPRAYGAWALPVLALLVWSFVRFVAPGLVRDEQKRPTESSAALLASMTAAFVSAIHGAILYVALVPGASFTEPLFVLTGALFVGLGLVFRRLRRVPLVSLGGGPASEESWSRIHRLASYSLVLGGVAGGAAGLVGGVAGRVTAIGCFLAATLVPTAYSIVVSRRGTHP